MDRAQTQQHLAQAEAAVVSGERVIERQRSIIAELQRDGHDVSRAIGLLDTFLGLQTQHVQHRDRLRRERAG